MVNDWRRKVSLELRYPNRSAIGLINLCFRSKTYVDTILSALPPDALRLSSPVHSVRTLDSGKVLLTTVNGKSEEYDHVIMACHADASLAILKAGGVVTAEEERILGGFQWNKNVAVIHSDTKVMLLTEELPPRPDILVFSSCLRTRTRGRVGITSRSHMWTILVCTVLTTTLFLGKLPSANWSSSCKANIHVVHVSERVLGARLPSE